MYCRKCGREIPDDSVMCGYCGTPTNPDNPYTYGGTPQNMDEGANGLGIASMILGIVAILLACCAGGKWLTFLVAAAGLILGVAPCVILERENRRDITAAFYLNDLVPEFNGVFYAFIAVVEIF